MASLASGSLSLTLFTCLVLTAFLREVLESNLTSQHFLRAQEHLEDRFFRRIGVSDPAILVPVIRTEPSELDERQQMRCGLKGQRMLHSRQRSDNEGRI
ncbi:uncharacterized [Tachysurus ichikawai]